VLRDLIDSGIVPVVRLTEVFRQAVHSRIITAAHRVWAGRLPDLAKLSGGDLLRLTRSTKGHTLLNGAERTGSLGSWSAG
jgi:hypothetical protein